MKKEKKFIIINIVLIFLFSFITHNLYKWFPSSITTLFPVNESLFEHLKMIFITPVIIGSILYGIFYLKKMKINNYLLGLYVSCMLNIVIFYIIYLPVYNIIGENMIFTIIWYFISIVLSQLVNYIIINKDNNKNLNITSLGLIFINIVVLLYLTYNPVISNFFLDPINHYYGIR